MIRHPTAYSAMPLGIVIQRRPGVTRWVPTVWSVRAVLPGAGPADWRVLRQEGEAVEYHAGTVPLELHGAETEAYVHNLTARAPSIYVVMRQQGPADHRPEIVLVTASPYEAQDYTDSGEEMVAKVAIPPSVGVWIEEFVTAHHVEQSFKKRRRDRKDVDLVEDGIGDARIAQPADVYRSPASKRERLQ